MYAVGFFTLAVVMFLVIKDVNQLKTKEAEEVATGPLDNALLCGTRDLFL